MTNREQAIRRVAKELGISVGEVRSRLESGVFQGTAYMVDTTERGLKLEVALRRLIDDCSGRQPCDSNCTSDDCPFFRARQVLQPKGE